MSIIRYIVFMHALISNCVLIYGNTNCPVSIVQNAPIIVSFSQQIQSGDFESIEYFFTSCTNLCQNCDLNCIFLNFLDQGRFPSSAIDCVNELANILNYVSQQNGTDYDILGDYGFEYRLYQSIANCNKVILNNIPMDNEEYTQESEGEFGEEANQSNFEEWENDYYEEFESFRVENKEYFQQKVNVEEEEILNKVLPNEENEPEKENQSENSQSNEENTEKGSSESESVLDNEESLEESYEVEVESIGLSVIKSHNMHYTSKVNELAGEMKEQYTID